MNTTPTPPRDVLFDPARLPPPDADGFFEHPDICAIFGKNEPSMDEVVFTLLARGWQAEYVSGNDLVDEETGEYTAVGWCPTLPQDAGLKAVYESHTDGWRLVSVYDSEDGPMALFVRPVVSEETSKFIRERQEYLERAKHVNVGNYGSREDSPYWQTISLALERCHDFAFRNVALDGAHAVMALAEEAQGYVQHLRDRIERALAVQGEGERFELTDEEAQEIASVASPDCYGGVNLIEVQRVTDNIVNARIDAARTQEKPK